MHPFTEIGFDMIEDEKGEEIPAAIGIYDGEDGVVIIPIDIEEKAPMGQIIVVRNDEHLVDESSTVYELGEDDEAFGFAGTLKDMGTGKPIEYTLAIDIGGGTSTFRLDGEVAFLNGELGSGTYAQVEYLIEHHKEIKKIIFEQVPGSVNDDVNVLTGRLIHDAGYITEVKSDSMIASGGVDLFLGGTRRIVADGAQIGVHSWSDGPGGDLGSPADLPRDHPAHKMQIAYFSYVMPENGVDFYFYTLNAAEAEDIHWMSEDEIKAWGIAKE